MNKKVKILMIILCVIAVVAIIVGIVMANIDSKEANEINNNETKEALDKTDKENISAADIIGTGADLFNEADRIANESVNSMDALYGDLVEAEILKYCDTKIKAREAKTLMSLLDQNGIEYLFISSTGEIDESAKYVATASFSENGRIKQVIIEEQ